MDDHPIVRSGLAQIINQEDDLIVAGEASDSNEAIDGIEKIKPVLAIVDISLKGSSGIELTKQILRKRGSLSQGFQGLIGVQRFAKKGE